MWQHVAKGCVGLCRVVTLSPPPPPLPPLQIYLVILTVRILLSWFRTIDWYTEPWNTLRQVS